MNCSVHRVPESSPLMQLASSSRAATSRGRSGLGMVALALSAACAASPGAGNTTEIGVRSVTFEAEASCPSGPEQCWVWFTQDVDQWWDHTFSDTPHALVLDARVGGSFYESFDGAGNGAEHARVIFAKKPEMLRLDGPLGLSGLAVHMVHELRFEAGAGGETRVSVRVQLSGAVDDETVGAVEGVWEHFLVQRYQAYAQRMASGAGQESTGG